MGWLVISKGCINFPETTKDSLIDKIYDQMTNMRDRNKENAFVNLRIDPNQISFEIWGNKEVNYSYLEKIKKQILKELKKKKGFYISSSEFVESDELYFYEYEEEENEKN